MLHGIGLAMEKNTLCKLSTHNCNKREQYNNITKQSQNLSPLPFFFFSKGCGNSLFVKKLACRNASSFSECFHLISPFFNDIKVFTHRQFSMYFCNFCLSLLPMRDWHAIHIKEEIISWRKLTWIVHGQTYWEYLYFATFDKLSSLVNG